MNPDEEQQLRELGEELAQLEQSPWQPRCIARAFARNGELFTLTMQGWIDLDYFRSPLLEGKLPEGDDVIQQIADALIAFNHDPESILKLEPGEAVILSQKMLRAVNRAFETSLRMVRPGGGDTIATDGFGNWAPILTCLISQLGMSRMDALECPVDQAFALMATDKHNAAWNVAGEPYAMRDLADKPSTLPA